MWLIILGDQITRPQCLLSFSEQKVLKQQQHSTTKRALATVSVIKSTKDYNDILSNDVKFDFLNEMFW